MTMLPTSFTERMKRQLGAEYEEFLSEYEKESFRGIRVNTGKVSAAEFSSLCPFPVRPVPWVENGYYYSCGKESVTRHPYYYAGLYYVQEPSAMLPASRLPVRPGDAVLDLCAAPGGKATELASRLKGEGLLVANDVSATRAKALVKNLSVWGTGNSCVTAETPQRLLQAFGCCFDAILVDAPCSGEGMFRKEPALVKSWEQKGPEAYVPLQREILDCAVQMLRPGGFLLYSTCTFSQEEDEGAVAWLLDRYPSLSMADIEPRFAGFAAGSPPAGKSVRVWPHRMEGEGHFLALLRKSGTGGPGLARVSPDEIAGSQTDAPQAVKAFLAGFPRELLRDRLFVRRGDQCYLVPPYRLPGSLRFLSTGLLVGTVKGNRLEPAQPLAMALGSHSYGNTADFSSSDVRAVKYLKGETVELTSSDPPCKDGWVLVCVDGFALGWGKCLGGTIRNKYNPGWRMQ